VRFERAMILIDASRIDAAEKELRAVTTERPDFYDAQRVLGRLILDRAGQDREKVDDALAHLQAAFKVNPDDLGTGMAVAQIQQREGEWQKASELLQPLINDDPMNLDLQRQQAFFYLKAGLPEKARAAFKTLVEADPKDARSQYYLAEALNDLEEYEQADAIY